MSTSFPTTLYSLLCPSFLFSVYPNSFLLWRSSISCFYSSFSPSSFTFPPFSFPSSYWGTFVFLQILYLLQILYPSDIPLESLILLVTLRIASTHLSILPSNPRFPHQLFLSMSLSIFSKLQLIMHGKMLCSMSFKTWIPIILGILCLCRLEKRLFPASGYIRSNRWGMGPLKGIKPLWSSWVIFNKKA